MSACLFVFFFCVYLFIYFNYSNKLNVALKMRCDKLVKIVVAVVESAHKVFTVLFPFKQNPVNTCFKRLRRLYVRRRTFSVGNADPTSHDGGSGWKCRVELSGK